MSSTQFSRIRLCWTCDDCKRVQEDQDLDLYEKDDSFHGILPFSPNSSQVLNSSQHWTSPAAKTPLSSPNTQSLNKPEESKCDQLGKGLVIAHVNLNGVKNKFEELQSFLVSNTNVMYLAVTESKLDISDDLTPLNIVSFNLVRNDRNRCGGGTLIYIHHSVTFEIIETPVQFPHETEIVIVKLKHKGIQPILVVLVYNPPNNSKSDFLASFAELVSQLKLLKLELIFLGDFNIDLLTFSAETLKLFNIRKEYNLAQVITGPTRVANTKKGTTSTLLDHIYTDTPDKYAHNGHFPFAGSDHDFTFITRKLRKTKLSPKQIDFRSFNKVDWTEALKEFDLMEFDYLLTSNIDDNLWTFRKQILQLIDSFAPIRSKLIKGRANPWFNNDLLQLTIKRNKLKKIASFLKTHESWCAYKKARNETNISIRLAKVQYFKLKFQESCNSISIWKCVDKLTGYRAKPSTPVTSFSNPDGTVTTDTNDIFDSLAKSFIVQPTSDTEVSITNTIRDYCSGITQETTTDLMTISPDEVSDSIKALRMNSSVSQLYIPVIILKKFRDSIAIPLAILFTQILLLSKIPQSFKTAIVIPLYKGKGSRSNPDNYRPISILNSLSKIFEYILFIRLRKLVEPLLSEEQHGFRLNRSCHTALSLFTQDVFNSIDKRNSRVGAVFVDLKKAFNSVDHDILVFKLITIYHLHPIYVKLINDYLTNRLFQIKNNNCLSTYYNEPAGIPQGSSLGPLLFVLFIDDISEVIQLPYYLYADDLVIYAKGTDVRIIVDTLNTTLADINSWCLRNRLTISSAKTEFMLFHKSHDHNIGSVPDVTLDGQPIARVYKFKYLGIFLDPGLSFMQHYSHVNTRLSIVTGKLNYVRRFLTPNLVKILVNAYVLPVYDYCIDIWAVQSLNELNFLQNKVNTFLFSSLYPSLFSKLRRSCKKNVRRNKKPTLRKRFDMDTLLKECNILSIAERVDWTRLKNVIHFKLSPVPKINSFFTFSSNTRSSRTLPLITMDSCNSETFRKSVKFKSSKTWNSLPKDWDIQELLESRDLDKFKGIVFTYLVEKRKDEWLLM